MYRSECVKTCVQCRTLCNGKNVLYTLRLIEGDSEIYVAKFDYKRNTSVLYRILSIQTLKRCHFFFKDK